MTNSNSDPDFCFSSSSSVPTPYHHHKTRKKRTKFIQLEPNLSPPSPSRAIITTTATASTNTDSVSRPKFHGKKPDPSAPKITKPCTECGKKFWSLKALFGHMRCHPERQWRGINPPPNHRRPISPIPQSSDLQPVMTEEEHDVAACLLMLANSDPATVLEPDCGRASGAVIGSFQGQEEMNCRFECSSCKKVFGSHQALGGHRASHKNVKGCFAITRNDGCELVEDHSGSGDLKENVEDNNSNNNKMVMMLGHKCSICLRVFSSGQALGGHKRRHWEKGEEVSSSMVQGTNVFAAKEGPGLDLNKPAPLEDESCSSHSSQLALDLRLGL